MSRINLVLAVILLVAWPQAHSESTATAFTKCARIANDARRLSCYDRLASDLIELGISNMDASTATAAPASGVPAQSAPAAAAAPAQEPAQAPSTDVAPATQTGSTENASSAAVAATTASAAVSPEVEAEFGMERAETKQAKELKKIQSRYVGEFTGWDGDTEFQLENGQVWKQIRSGRLAWRADSPMITIDRKGFMGAYRLSVEGVNKKVIVRRLK
jgi:hypothetical protein